MTREQWLSDAAQLINDRLFAPAGLTTNGNTGRPLLEGLRVSVGWPTHRALSRNGRVVGQCIAPGVSKSGYTEIFVSPFLDDGISDGTAASEPGALETLVHEMGHAAAGQAAGHKRDFLKVCKAVGLDGPATATRAGMRLNGVLSEIIEELGPYPHAKLDITQIKKEPTRLLKASCINTDCPTSIDGGDTVRFTRKWVDVAYPTSPVCGEVMHVPAMTPGDDGGTPPNGPAEIDPDDEPEPDVGYEGDYDPDAPENEEPDPYAGDEPSAGDGDPSGDGDGESGDADGKDESSSDAPPNNKPGRGAGKSAGKGAGTQTPVSTGHTIDPNCSAGENGGPCLRCREGLTLAGLNTALAMIS